MIFGKVWTRKRCCMGQANSRTRDDRAQDTVPNKKKLIFPQCTLSAHPLPNLLSHRKIFSVRGAPRGAPGKEGPAAALGFCGAKLGVLYCPLLTGFSRKAWFGQSSALGKEEASSPPRAEDFRAPEWSRTAEKLGSPRACRQPRGSGNHGRVRALLPHFAGSKLAKHRHFHRPSSLDWNALPATILCTHHPSCL